MSDLPRMPAVFLGHGSPLNAIEDNRYTRAWASLGQRFPRPAAILVISAHWMTRGLALTAMAQPPTIHDFGGFPPALYEMRYPAPGDPALAQRVAALLAPLEVRLDQEWGLDHGAWAVLCKAYPQAQVPVLQLSLDLSQPAAWHFELGRKLAPLREQGVLLLASGNLVHNLRRMDPRSAGYDWAQRFNHAMRAALLQGDFGRIVDYQHYGQDAALAVPTPEHFLPLLYVLGSRQPDDQLEILSDGLELGSISMLSLLLA